MWKYFSFRNDLLPNTNPWRGAGYVCPDCHTSQQGGPSDKKEDRFKRNILYESRCATCSDRKELENEGRKRKRFVDYEEEDIYVGETSKSIYERAKEHIRDGRARDTDSHIARHWEE